MDKTYFESKKNIYGKSALSEVKSYTHFDAKISMRNCWEYISDPQKIASHNFLPFLRFEKIFDKYVVEDKRTHSKIKEQKAREICYASHLDGCIYSYYAAELNAKYNDMLKNDGIDLETYGKIHSWVVAYRTNLHGKSNIDFAHEAIQFIRNQKNCMVIIGDFKNFFDRLDHSLLKQQIKKVLKTEHLSNDWYAVIKSVTRYSYVDLAQVIYRTCKNNNVCFKQRYRQIRQAEAGIISPENDFKCSEKLCPQKTEVCNESYRKIQRFAGVIHVKLKDGTKKTSKGHCTNRICNKAFNSLKKIDIQAARNEKLIKVPHRKNADGQIEAMGIPQGSAISSVLANVYMLDFDKNICDYIKPLGGQYMRYSDDFIIILPKDGRFNIHYDFLKSQVSQVRKLDLQPAKTKIFEVNLSEKQPIRCCTNEYENTVANGKDIIDYLGFSFDGTNASIKDKTIFKYYYRMYSKIKYIKRQRAKVDDIKKIGSKNLYQNYTSFSFHWRPKNEDKVIRKTGNFLTYVKNVKRIFVEDADIDVPTRHHLSKIATRLNGNI